MKALIDNRKAAPRRARVAKKGKKRTIGSRAMSLENSSPSSSSHRVARHLRRQVIRDSRGTVEKDGHTYARESGLTARRADN